MQVAELLVGVPAPIMYWEQGHEWLFGDPVRFQVCGSPHMQPACIAAALSCTSQMGSTSSLGAALVNSVAMCVF